MIPSEIYLHLLVKTFFAVAFVRKKVNLFICHSYRRGIETLKARKFSNTPDPLKFVHEKTGILFFCIMVHVKLFIFSCNAKV